MADIVGEKFDLGLLPQQAGTKEQLLRRAKEMRQQLADKISIARGPSPRAGNPGLGSAILRGGTEGILGAALGLPDIIATGALNIGADALRKITPDPLASKIPQAPPLGSHVLPFMPTPVEMMGSARNITELLADTVSPGGASMDPYETERLKSEAAEAQHPLAYNAAKTIGSVATIRAPIARARALQEMSAVEKTAQYKAAAQAANEAGKLKGFRFAESIPEAFKQGVAQSEGYRTLLNRTGRAIESGLEGATIAILQEGDPLETAAFAAGGQAAGSVALAGLSGIFSGGPLQVGGKLALSAVSIGAILQTLKSVTPGGQDFSLASVESGFNKVALGVATGVLAGVAGAGRFPIKSLPAVSDYITSIPRAASISVANDALNDTRVETVINKLQSDPEYFGPTAMRRMERAFRNPNISMSGVIDDLMEQKAFREKYEALEK